MTRHPVQTLRQRFTGNIPTRPASVATDRSEPDGPRFGVCAIARNEADYLLEWVAHYQQLGVHGIHVYDNVSDDGTSELLTTLDLAGELSRVHWPRREGANPQRAAYQHFLGQAANRYDWVLFCDIDEFLMVPGGLAAFVAGAERADPQVTALAIPWLMFGADQQERQTKGLVTERFVGCAATPGPSVKTLVRPSAALNLRVHVCDLIWGHYLDSSYSPPRWDPAMPVDLIQPQPGHALLYHYYTKSREEWVRRRSAPRANRVEVSFRNLRGFERYWSLPATEESARRQAPRLRVGVDRLRRVVAGHDAALAGLGVEMIAISSTAVVGRVTGGPIPAGLQVRVVVDGTEEQLAPVALGADGRVFRCGLRWSGVAPDTVRCALVGRSRATVFKATEFANHVRVLARLMRFLPAAEDMIFSTALRTARSQQRLARMQELPWPEFASSPWFGEFWSAVFLVEADRDRGRAAFGRLATAHPAGVAGIGAKLVDDRAGHLGALLDAAAVDRMTLVPR